MGLFGEGTDAAAARCSSCGVDTRPDWVFCDACGAPLKSGAASESAPASTGDKATVITPTVNATPTVDATEPITNVFSVPVPPPPAESPADPAPSFAPPSFAPSFAAPAASLPMPAYSDPVPVAPAGSGRGWMKVTAIGALVVIVIAALAVGVLNSLGTRDRLSSTRKELASTKQDLAGTNKTLDSTKHDLTARSTALDLAKGQLADANQQLTGTKQSLADANARVNLQAGQLSTLRTCINGITQGLDLAAQGQTSAALAAINAVESACNEAGV